MAKKNKGKSKNKTGVNSQKPNTETETKESERGKAVEYAVNTSNSEEAWKQDLTSKESEERKNSPQKNDDWGVDAAQKMPSEDYQKRNERWQDSSQKGDRRVYDNKYVPRRSEPLKGYGNDRFDNRRGIDKRRSCNDNVDENKRTSYGRRSDSFINDRRNEDPEFMHWQDTYRANNGNIEYVKTHEIDKDLFQMPKEFSLAHCVAEDLNMGSGIAVAFRREFKRVDQLLNQRQKTGGLAVLEDNDRFIYYLITKQFSTGKPTNATLFASLQKLREHVIDHQVTKLSMPRIGCGLDRLRWVEVKNMIEFIFRNVEIEIVICNLVQTDDKSTPPRYKNSEVVNVTYPIENIESETIIVYLSSEDGHISEEMSKLDNKFHFLTEFRFAAKRIGTVVTYTKNENYLLCGCIVRRKETDPVDFEAFQRCLYDIRKMNNAKYKFDYIAFQAMRDKHDDSINWKIINILRNTIRTCVYICWVGDLQNELLAKERDTKPRPSLDKDLQGPNRQETNKGADDGNWRTSNSGRTLEFNNSSQYNSSWNQAPSTAGATSTADFKVESDWDMSPEKESSFTEYREEHEEKEIDWFENNENTPNLQNSNLASSTNNVQTHSGERWDSDRDDHLQSPHKKYKTSDNITWKESRNLNKTGPDRKVYGTLYSDRIDIKLRKVSISESNEDDDIASINHEFEMFEEELEQGRLKKSSVVKDVDNPSDLPKQYSRACYVTQRMNVESSVPYGINIRDYLGQLLDQNKKEGDVAVVKHEREILYSLIIKQAPNTTPKRKMVFTAIKKMWNHAIKNHIQTIVVPKLDDKSSWDDFCLAEIKCMLEFIFKDKRIKIFMAPFEPVSHPEIKVEHSKSALHQMKKGSVILYWASKDGYVTDEIKSLERNFKLIQEFQNEAKFKGEIITHRRDNITLYGCVIRDYYSDPINFTALQECINDINKSNQTKSSPLAGIQAVNDRDDDTNFKIISLLETCLQNVTTLKVCWPGHLKEKMPC